MRHCVRRFILQIVLFAFSLTFAACVTTNQDSSADNDPMVISQEEIQSVGEVSNAYNLIQQLQPQWLQKRGRASVERPSDVTVYVEDSRYRSPEALRQIHVVNVESIAFLRPDRATMRFGSGHDNGAILVNLKEGR